MATPSFTASTIEDLRGRVPQPVTPGPEMAALCRFHVDCTWTGSISADGVGPGSPAMMAVGSGRHRELQGGRWIEGTYEQDQYLLDGSFVLTWQLHWVAGWDPTAGEYRATVADNYGHADVLRGWIDGDRLTFETIGTPAIRLRLVWDRTDPDSPTWRNEASVGGGESTLVEAYRIRPIHDPDRSPEPLWRLREGDQSPG